MIQVCGWTICRGMGRIPNHPGDDDHLDAAVGLLAELLVSIRRFLQRNAMDDDN